MKKKLIYITVLAAVLGFGVVGCGQSRDLEKSEPVQNVAGTVAEAGESTILESEEITETDAADGEDFESDTAEETTETFREIIETVELVAVGDNLIHEGLYQTGMNSSGEWNYDHVYANVADEIQAADLAIINQETIFIKDRAKISAYPRFGSPPEIGDSLVTTGFDVVLHASNHTVDKGAEGVWDTINFWKEKHPEITVLGINESAEEQNTIDIVECNGIRFAMLNYTYGLNGLPMPSDAPFAVNLLDKDKMKEDIANAKEISDMVVVFLHVGDEYVYQPSETAKQWVDFLLEQGVDIAINAHPHVLEPYTMLTREDGHQMLVYYSVGNFASTQDRVPRLLGGMAKITVEMRIHEDGKDFTIKDYSMEPLVCHWNYRTKEFFVYMLEDYTEETAAGHGIHRASDEEFSVQILWDLYEEIMSTEVTPAKGKLPE